MNRVILASTSKYRKTLLEQIGLKVTSVAPKCDESIYKKDNIEVSQLAKKLSQLKAQSIANNYSTECIIAGDQIASVNSVILNKPKTVDRAIRQLEMLQGQTHHLYTAVTVIFKGVEHSFVNDTSLTMRHLCHSEISNYIKKDLPLDCAGSYKIESLGINLFKHIESSDHSAIVGIPLMQLSNLLRELGINPLED